MPTAPAEVLPAKPQAASAPAVTPPPAHALRPLGYFQRRWPAALVLAAFPALALPMAAAVLLSASNLLLWAYVWLFGMTHFVATLALYARSENLRHFASTRGNRLVFFALPVTLIARAGMGMMGRDPGAAGRPFEYLALIAVFDGLFVFHYFVEMFVWRFGDPHFRKELSGLYFAPGK